MPYQQAIHFIFIFDMVHSAGSQSRRMHTRYSIFSYLYNSQFRIKAHTRERKYLKKFVYINIFYVHRAYTHTRRRRMVYLIFLASEEHVSYMCGEDFPKFFLFLYLLMQKKLELFETRAYINIINYIANILLMYWLY